MTFTFIYEDDSAGRNTTVSISADCEGYEHLVETFQLFSLACSYQPGTVNRFIGGVEPLDCSDEVLPVLVKSKKKRSK